MICVADAFATPIICCFVTFCVTHSRGEMYSGHGCLCVCLSFATFPHYCADPDVSCGNGRGCPIVVHYWEDLQSVHGFRCYDNSGECKMSVSACTRYMPG